MSGIFINAPAPTAASLEQESLHDVPYNNAASVLNSDAGLTTGQGTFFNYLSSLFTGNTSALGSNFLGSGTNSLLGGFGSLFGNQDFTAMGQKINAPDTFWTDIFLRGTIIILGFIFTAIGLSMFGNKTAITIVNETKRSFK